MCLLHDPEGRKVADAALRRGGKIAAATRRMRGKLGLKFRTPGQIATMIERCLHRVFARIGPDGELALPLLSVVADLARVQLVALRDAAAAADATRARAAARGTGRSRLDLPIAVLPSRQVDASPQEGIRAVG